MTGEVAWWVYALFPAIAIVALAYDAIRTAVAKARREEE